MKNYKVQSDSKWTLVIWSVSTVIVSEVELARLQKGIDLTENGSNKRHVILMDINAYAHYQMPV